MDDSLLPAFGDSWERTAHKLAGLSGVNLTQATRRTVRLWKARGLRHLAEGDMDEAPKVLDAIQSGGSATKPASNQPPIAAKETP